MQILKLIEKDFIFICTDKRGTHTVQTIIDTLSIPEEEKILKNCLSGKIFELSIDQQGTHVVQKLLRCGFEKKCTAILNELSKSFVELCVNRNGLCVAKILIQKTKDSHLQQALMGRISKEIMNLVCHPFGNYAIT